MTAGTDCVEEVTHGIHRVGMGNPDAPVAEQSDPRAPVHPKSRNGRADGDAPSASAYDSYKAMLDESNQSFLRISGLPLYSGTPWHSFFHKAFQVHSALWKFQQDQRDALVEQGLQRWDIGEIASKIGQLYHLYYARTGETRFLLDAHTFYDAIRSRQYFGTASENMNESMSAQQLRYYARFMFVCIMLGRVTEVRQLCNELQALVLSHSLKFQDKASAEWSLVITEWMQFLEADTLLQTESVTAPIQPQYSPRLPPSAYPAPPKGVLSEALLITYYHQHVKVAEVPLDTFRMMQALEWDPSGASPPESVSLGDAPDGPRSRYINPPKVNLYRPSMSRVLACLSTSSYSLHRSRYLLLYISADLPAVPVSATTARAIPELERRATTLQSAAVLIHPPPTSERRGRPPSSLPTASEHGPTATVADAAVASSTSHSPPPAAVPAPNATDPDQLLRPEDLLPFTRKRLFLVVDSDAAHLFGSLYAQSLGCPPLLLLSPLRQLPAAPPASSKGKMFTMFLATPLKALVHLLRGGVCLAEELPALQSALDELVGAIDASLAEAEAHADAGLARWRAALLDPFLRRFVLHFVLCRGVLHQLAEDDADGDYAPRAVPELPGSLDAGSAPIACAVRTLLETFQRA